MAKRPNILFIMTDEQKNDTFSRINPVVKTPNLDPLISESIFFSHGYCGNPSSVPSRAAIVTGKFPTACQCPTYISKLPENEVTFIENPEYLPQKVEGMGKIVDKMFRMSPKSNLVWNTNAPKI